MEKLGTKNENKTFYYLSIIFVENEQTFCYISQDNCLHYESTHS